MRILEEEREKELVELLIKATKKWGEKSQISMLGEEASETIKEIFKLERDGHLKEKYINFHKECADLYIVLMGCVETAMDKELFIKSVYEKMERLDERLKHRNSI